MGSKLANALSKSTKGLLARDINLEKEKQALTGNPLKGRQILLLVHQHFRITEAEGHIMDFSDLMSVKMYGDDLRSFHNDWEMTLVSMHSVPEKALLESMFRTQIEKHPGLKEDMAYYERLPRDHEHKNYGFLFSVVRRFLEKQRAQKAKAERSKSGVRPSTAATDDRPICFAYQRGKCTQGRNCKYKHEKSAQSPAAHPRKNSRLRKGAKERKDRDRSSSREKPSICRFYLQGKCTKCEKCPFAHPSPCIFLQRDHVRKVRIVPMLIFVPRHQQAEHRKVYQRLLCRLRETEASLRSQLNLRESQRSRKNPEKKESRKIPDTEAKAKGCAYQ